MERYNPDYKSGLNAKQVNKRKEENLINIDTTVKTKSVKSIIVSNFFTLFNIMNFILALLIFFVGAYKNLLFIIIVILNTLISTIQEIYSKKTIDNTSQNKFELFNNSSWDNNYDNAAIQTIGNLT